MTRRVVAIAAGVVVLVLIGWYALLWSPKGAELHSAKAAVTKADNGHVQLTAEVAALQAAEQKLPAELDSLNQSLSAVPVNPGIPALIDQLQQSANRAGVTVASESQAVGDTTAASPSVAASSAAVSTVSLDIAVSGSYMEVVDFVRTLEQSPRLVVVDTLNFTAASSIIQATVTARAFYNPTVVPDLHKIGAGT